MMKNTFCFLMFLFITHWSSINAQNIGHTTITFNDPNRTGGYGSGGGSGRQIQTEIYYPAATAGDNVPCNGTNLPVLVFGHGFVMSWDSYANIWQHFVAAGYVIAFPRTEGGISPSHGDFGKDLALVCEKMLALNTNSTSIFNGKLNGKSAIMGHSMGGGSSFLAMQNNSNVTTMVTFAAANTNPSSQAAAKLIQKPALVIAGENDCVAKPNDHQKPMYDSLASAHKGYLVIKGGGHCYFANTNFNCSTGEGTCTPNPTITRSVQQSISQYYTQKWLDYFLKDDCNAWEQFKDSINLSTRVTYQSNFNFNNPTITLNGNNLTSSTATTYQWFKDGVLMNAQTNQILNNPDPGDYYVEVTYANGCKYRSNTITITATGLITYFNKENFSIHPNPAQNEIVIELPELLEGEVVIEIIDLTGRSIRKNEIRKDIGAKKLETINLEGLLPGCYSVNLKHKGLIVNKTILKH